MTRFARADGSKASNKRSIEDATSWEEMKLDLCNAATKKKSKKLSKKEKSNKKVVDSSNTLELSASKLSNKELESEIPEEENVDMPKKKKKKLQKTKLSKNETVSREENKTNGNEDEDIEKKERENEDEDGSKKKWKKKLSLEEKKNNYVIEEGVKYKIFKNGVKKPWFDLPYGESEIMTKYNNCYVKREDVAELNKYKKALEAEGLLQKEVKNKMLNRERKAHNKLRVELLREQISTEEKPTKKSHKKPHKEMKQSSKDDDSAPTNSEVTSGTTFEENDIMTNFDGFWVKRSSIEHLNELKAERTRQILAKRTDSSLDEELTPDEIVELGRRMKKEKRRENRFLKHFLNSKGIQGDDKCNGEEQTSKPKKKKPGKYLGIEFKEDNEMVKFGMHFVKKEAADRLKSLRDSLLSKGCSEEEVRVIMKNECRKEERMLKRERKLFCFKCRQVGHLVTTCPSSREDGTQGVEICFRCGSTEHMARNCTVNKGASYKHANCFICGEVGHISKECPDNPRGLYPNGGCCNECGSVEHLKKDCPEFVSRVEDLSLKATRLRPNMEIETLDFGNEATKEEPKFNKGKGPKIIKFDD